MKDFQTQLPIPNQPIKKINRQLINYTATLSQTMH